MEPILENQTRSTPVQCHKESKKQQLQLQRNETEMALNDSGYDNNAPPETTTSEIEERIVSDQVTN